MRATRVLSSILFLMVSVSCSTTAAVDNKRAVISADIEKAVNAKTQEDQQAAFDDIVALGCTAAPDIAALMDDRRSLPIPYLRLDNDYPGAFESIRQYGPELVVDALAAILNDLTGSNFGFIFNGASDDERREAVRQWQAFTSRPDFGEVCEDRE